MKKIIVFTVLLVSSIGVKAQDVLTKINGGASWVSGVVAPMKFIVSSYTLDESDYTVIVGGAIPPTITLPAASSFEGKIYRILRTVPGIGVNGTISRYVSKSGGSNSTTYSYGNVLVLQSDGSWWKQIN